MRRQPCYGIPDFDSVLPFRGGKMRLGILGTNRVEIEEHFCPFTQRRSEVLHSSHRNVFAGVAKGYAPASFGEQEKEL